MIGVDIEAHDREVADTLIEELMQCIGSGRLIIGSNDPDELYHVSYHLPDTADIDDVITCRVAGTYNEVGLKLWEAAFFLAEYVLAEKEMFHDKYVLELGAGVGFTGFVLAKCARPKHVLLTDYAPQVMQNLRYNIEINEHQFTCPVEACALDWSTYTNDEGSKQPDILLAGDCVYDVANFPSLVQVLNLFLIPSSGIDGVAGVSSRVAIFASTIRNQQTFQTFLEQLKSHRIDYADITVEALSKMTPPTFTYENKDSIRLCKLFKTSL